MKIGEIEFSEKESVEIQKMIESKTLWLYLNQRFAIPHDSKGCAFYPEYLPPSYLEVSKHYAEKIKGLKSIYDAAAIVGNYGQI